MVQNPFDKHGKQVHDALFKQKWLKQFSAGKTITENSHYIIAIFLLLQTFQALDKSAGRIWDRILFDETQYNCSCGMSLCRAVCDWRVFVTFYLQTDQMKKLGHREMLPNSGKRGIGVSFRIIIVMLWCWSGKVCAKQSAVFNVKKYKPANRGCTSCCITLLNLFETICLPET